MNSSVLRLTKNIILVLFLIMLPFYGLSNAAVIDDTIAVVNDEPITAVDLYQTMKYYGISNAKKALNQIIEDKLIEQRAEKMKLKLDVGEYKSIKSRILTAKRLKIYKKLGLTTSDLDHFIKLQVLKRELISSVVRENIDITDGQIKSYYDDNLKRFKMPDAIHLYQLPFYFTKQDEKLTEVKAANWLTMIKNGSVNFMKAVKKLNYKKYDLGWINTKDLYPSFYKIVQGMKTNDVYGLIKTTASYSIIKLVGRRRNKTVPLSKIRNKIKTILANRNGSDALERWISTLKQYSAITIYAK